MQPLPDPVALGVRGTTALEFDNTRTAKTVSQHPEEFQCGTILRIEDFENHGSTGFQRVQTG